MGRFLKDCGLALLVPAAILAVALAANGVGAEALLPSRTAHLPAYLFMQAVQLLFALVPALVLAFAIGVVGAGIRWLVARAHGGRRTDAWQALPPEGLAVGVVAVGICLGWSPTDVYPNPKGDGQIELRQPSLIEGPFGFFPCSDCYIPVTVTYRDGQGRRRVRRECEGREQTDTDRIRGRTIRWSTEGPERVVVLLPETGQYVFFPDCPLELDHSPPDEAVQAYLRGKPPATVLRLDREAER